MDDRTDVEVDLDPFGQGGRCAGGANNREKSLCCESSNDFPILNDWLTL